MLKSDSVELRRRKRWVETSPASDERREVMEVSLRRKGAASPIVTARRRAWLAEAGTTPDEEAVADGGMPGAVARGEAQGGEGERREAGASWAMSSMDKAFDEGSVWCR